MFIDEIYV